MKSISSFVLAVFTCIITTHAQDRKIEDSAITKEAIINDMDVYARRISKLHIHPFSCIKKSDFFDKISQIQDSATQYNIDELLIKWLQVNALLHDGHTRIEYHSITRDAFPISCQWYNEGIYINRISNAGAGYRFAKVIALNGLPIDTVAARLATIIPDTAVAAIRAYVPPLLSSPVVIHGLGLSKARDKVTYTVITQAGDTTTISPGPMDKKDIKFMGAADTTHYYKSRKVFECKYADTGNYLYFKYGSCFEDKAHSISNLTKEAERNIKTKNPGKIIIDLRENGGGHTELLDPFIDFLNNSILHKKGGVYVLVCRHTYSAAIFNAVRCRNRLQAVIVGEETSGTVSFYAGTQEFTLPATGLKITYATNYWNSHEAYQGSLRPDIVIPDKLEYHLKKYDAVLDYAIKH